MALFPSISLITACAPSFLPLLYPLPKNAVSANIELSLTPVTKPVTKMEVIIVLSSKSFSKSSTSYSSFNRSNAFEEFSPEYATLSISSGTNGKSLTLNSVPKAVE